MVRRLRAVLLLNLALVAGLVAAGLLAHSLAVLATGLDYLADAAGVGLTLFALPRGPRARDRAALANLAWLLAVQVVVAVAAGHRLLTGTGRVEGLPVLVASAVAGAVMVAAALLLRAEDGFVALLLDAVTDAAAAGGAAAAGAVILLTGGLFWLDPLVALVIAVAAAAGAVQVGRRLRAGP